MQAARLLEPRPRTVRSKLIEIARALQLEAHFSKARDPRHLADAGAVRRQSGRRAGRRAGLVRRRRGTAGPGAGGVAGGDPAPAGGAAPGPPRRARAGAARPDICWPMAATMPTSAPADAAPRAPGVGGLPAGARGRHHARPAVAGWPWSGWPRSGWPRCRSASRWRCWSPTPRRGEIRALVSGGGGRRGAGGALDLTRAVRSPGSALKPFIYALAFQDGIAGPETRARRPATPLRHATRRRISTVASAGAVTAAEALRQSLNLPAVALLDRVGANRFAAMVQAAGVDVAAADGSCAVAAAGAGRRRHHTCVTWSDYTAPLATDGSSPGLASARRGADGAQAIPATPRRCHRGRGADPAIPGRRTAGHRLEDRHKLGRPRRLGGRFRRAIGRSSLGRPARWHAATRSDRARLRLAVAESGIFAVAARPTRDCSAAGGTIVRLRQRRVATAVSPPGATLSGDGPVTLRAMGGRRPLTFLVDGMPVAADPARREAAWLPPAPGFYRITILDSGGGSTRAAIRVR